MFRHEFIDIFDLIVNQMKKQKKMFEFQKLATKPNY